MKTDKMGKQTSQVNTNKSDFRWSKVTAGQTNGFPIKQIPNRKAHLPQVSATHFFNFTQEKCVNRDIFGQKLRLEDVLLI